MRIIPTTPINSFLTRVIGSTDIRGQGTNHAVEDINPFILLDEAATFHKKNIPPFGQHPHSGAMILTICLSGYLYNMTFKNGKEESQEVGPGPFLLALNANRGVVHDEHTSTENPTKLLQLAWLTGDDESDTEFQHVEKPLVLKLDGGIEIMLCAGTFRLEESGVICKQNPSITVLIVKLQPGSVFETDEFDKGNVFIYSIDYEEKRGDIMVNNGKACSSHVVDMTMEKGSEMLKIENKNSHVVSVLVGYGEPMQPKWKKLLMFNGFIFASSEEALKWKENEFEEFGAVGFGRKHQSKNV